MNSSTFDINNRALPVIQDDHHLNFLPPICNRITKVAIPFLMLYTPTALILTVALGCNHVWKNSNDTSEVIWTVCSIASTILFPKIGTVCSHAYQLDKDLRSISYRPLVIISTVCYIASVLYATPAMIAISLVAQAVLELWRARITYGQKDYIYTAGMIVLASVRLVFAGKQIAPLFKQNKHNFILMEKTSEDTPQFHSRKLLAIPENVPGRGNYKRYYDRNTGEWKIIIKDPHDGMGP